MAMRSLGVLALVLLLLATGGGVVETDTRVTPAAAKHRTSCRGIEHREVRGEEPTYTRKRLSTFTNSRRVCRGLWLPKPRRSLVPQGIAVTGSSAWISGYHHRKGYGKRPCRLIRVSLHTGRLLELHRAIYGQVGRRPRTYCRHGGGILQHGKYLWVVEASKLWLVNPSQRTSVLEARRAWRIEAPVRGSSIVATKTHLGLVPFQTRGVARIRWFSLKRLMRPGVLDLAVTSKGRSQLGASASTRIPRAVQGGIMTSAGRLFLTRSHLSCGELVTPSGRRLGFIPGAEGIQFSTSRRRLWAVSESGAQPYAVGTRKPMTPAVVSFEWPGLASGRPARCGFPKY